MRRVFLGEPVELRPALQDSFLARSRRAASFSDIFAGESSQFTDDFGTFLDQIGRLIRISPHVVELAVRGFE